MVQKYYENQIRVRYSETDQMGTFYNSRALEWFECGRTEALRQSGLAYAEMEDKGVMLPLTEAHLNYLGRARYDDLLTIRTRIDFNGKARLRFEIEISNTDTGADIVKGYTVHAITNTEGRPIRPPKWMTDALHDTNCDS